MEKEKIEDQDASAAASLMGRWSPSLNEKERVKYLKATAGKSKAASILGRLGGLSKSEKKLAAIRINAQKAGRHLKYTYTQKATAQMGRGIRGPQIPCIIPDEVAKKPDDYKDTSFVVFDEKDFALKGTGGIKYKACVYSFDKKGIILRHTGGGSKDKK